MKFSSSTLLLAGSLPSIGFLDEQDVPSRTGLPLDQTASLRIIARDPSTIVKCEDEFWVFYTGHGVPSFHSKDLVKWEPGPAVFQTAPVWHLSDRYLLFYAVSSFGKIVSAIGLATSPTLNPADPAYRWTDQGIVVQSRE